MNDKMLKLTHYEINDKILALQKAIEFEKTQNRPETLFGLRMKLEGMQIIQKIIVTNLGQG